MLSSSREHANKDVTMRVGSGEVVSAKAVGVMPQKYPSIFIILLLYVYGIN